MIGEPRDLLGRMADIDHGNVELVAQLFQIGEDFGLAFAVERGKRLVHQKDARASQERTSNTDALTLTARKRIGPTRQQMTDAKQFHSLGQLDPAAGWRNPLHAKFKIAQHRKVRKEAGLLKHIAQRALMHRAKNPPFLPDFIIDPHGCARYFFKSGQNAQDRGFARTRRSEQGTYPTPRQSQIGLQMKIAALQIQFQHNAFSHVFSAPRDSAYRAPAKPGKTAAACRQKASAPQHNCLLPHG